MDTGTRKVLAWQLSLLLLIFISTPARAQQAGHGSSAPSDPSRFDIFVGYSDWLTHGSVAAVPFQGSPMGATVNGAWYLNRSLGVQLDVKYYHNESNSSLTSVSIGPIMRFPQVHGFGTFVHVLGGAADISGPNVPDGPGYYGGTVHQEFANWGPQITLGGGVDYSIPGLQHHLSWRILQADYLFDHVKFGDGHAATLNSASLSTGFLLQLGSAAPLPPLTLACSATPDTIFRGEPVTLTGIATHLDPKKKTSYIWSGQGETIPGTDPIVTVNTANLQLGNYTVVGRVSEGPKAGQSATCKTGFIVREISNRSAGVPVRRN